MSRFTGKVKWFNHQKGFGFITPDNVKREFEQVQGQKGPAAENVTKLS